MIIYPQLKIHPVESKHTTKSNHGKWIATANHRRKIEFYLKVSEFLEVIMCNKQQHNRFTIVSHVSAECSPLFLCNNITLFYSNESYNCQLLCYFEGTGCL